MISWKSNLIKLFCLILVSAVVITSSGCEPLRKKFVRQKKKDQKEEFVPVLDPIDYPATVYSPENEYKKAYGLWKVWNKEFLYEIETGENDKRQLYLLNEGIAQLEEMKKVVRVEKQAKLVQVISVLGSLREQYDMSALVRRSSAIKRTVEQNAKIILNELNPIVMKDSLIVP